MAMRITPALFCISLIFSVSAAAQADPATDYLTARDHYIDEFKAQPSGDTSDRRMALALGDLGHRLNALIPPWHAPGFSAPGRLSLTYLRHDAYEFGVLDGLAYRNDHTTVVVTTPALLRHWIADHNRWWEGSALIPHRFDAAIRSVWFWTFALGSDSGAFFFGEVPVEIAGGKGVVLLAARTQGGPIERPEYLFTVVRRGTRVFVASQNLAVNIAQQRDCARQLEANSSDRRATQHADRDFRACFAPYLKAHPQYSAVLRQAQSLVDLLH
jgi:hypothetical protein